MSTIKHSSLPKNLKQTYTSTVARPDLDDCSFHLTTLEANITSEELSEEILINRKELSIQSLDCTWVIEAPKNQRIYLQFKDFNLEKANDCTFNFIEVYGSKTELYSKEGRLHQFCGSDTKPIFSKSNVLHLRFFTALSMEQTEIGIGFKTKLWVYYSLYRDLAEKGKVLLVICLNWVINKVRFLQPPAPTLTSRKSAKSQKSLTARITRV